MNKSLLTYDDTIIIAEWCEDLKKLAQIAETLSHGQTIRKELGSSCNKCKYCRADLDVLWDEGIHKKIVL